MNAMRICRATALRTAANLTVLLLIFSTVSFAGSTEKVRMKKQINDSWKFYKGEALEARQPEFKDESWTVLNVPHTWNNMDGQDGGDNYYRGTGWYRKDLDISKNYAGKKIFIEFDGVNRKTDLYLNGNHAGTHLGGFARFRFDLTPYVKFGSVNHLAVRVNNEINNSIPVNGDFTFYGGIYRNVRLIITDKVHVDLMDHGSSGLYVTTENLTPLAADLKIKTLVRNDDSLDHKLIIQTLIKDAENKVVAVKETSAEIKEAQSGSIEQNLRLDNPHLWNGTKDPYLYKVTVNIIKNNKIADIAEDNFGLRTIKIDSQKGLLLNGEHISLHGVNRHQDRQDKGWAISESDEKEDFNLIKEMGVNAIRVSHYQQSESWYSLCDKNGFIVWAEVPFVGKSNENNAFYDNAKEQMTELVRQNFNHPSVAVWGIGNETEKDSSLRLLKVLNQVVHEEDPARPSTYASDKADSDPLNFVSDVLAFNKYYGWYRGSTEDFSKWALKLHEKYPETKLAVSEYGAGASIYQHESNPIQRSADQPFHPEEYQALFHEKSWEALKDKDFIWGTFIWNMFDFASDQRNEGDHEGINDKGLVSYDRKVKKDAFYFYKANWTTKPMVYITQRRFTERTDAKTDVKVYSNLDSLELFVNGTSQGKTAGSNGVFLWKGISLKNGANKITAAGFSQGRKYTDKVKWNYIYKPETINVLASSYSRDTRPENVIDGKSETCWQSFGKQKRQFPQWVILDLGKARQVNGVKILWKSDKGYSYKYEILQSNDRTSFEKVVDKKDNSSSGETEDIFTTTSRYLKIQITGSSNEDGWPAISEIIIM